MNNSALVSDFMTKKVIFVNQKTPLLEAVDLMLQHNFNGLPVISYSGKLVGILTEYDLMIKGSAIHLPTFLKLLRKFDIYSKDKKFLGANVKKILAMKVSDAMNRKPFYMQKTATLSQAVKVFTQHASQNPIPIVDEHRKLVGILARYDVIKLLGAPSVKFKNHPNNRELDKNVNKFISDFEDQFLFVSRFRTEHWLIFSIIFLILGFLIAFAFILRIEAM
jgi:CBS domain-containing protein